MRRRGAWLVAAVFLAAAEGSAGAHMIPGDRTLVAQPECGGLALLATYHVPSGARGEVVDLLIRRASRSRRRAAAEAAMTIRALAGVRLELDGKEQPWDRVAVKLVEDPPGSGRAALVVLATVAFEPGAHTARLRVDDSGEPTAVSWNDRTSGGIAESGPVSAGAATQGPVTLEWTWREQCPAD